MHKLATLIFIALLFVVDAKADTYFVGFTDKAGCQYTLDHPETFLSERAIERRAKQNIAVDSTDLPVSALYLDSLRRIGVSIVHTTRWLNGATVTLPGNLTATSLKALGFIDIVQCTKRDGLIPIVPPMSKGLPVTAAWQQANATATDYAAEYIAMLRLDSLHSLGYHGQGIRIGVIDNGFLNVNSLSVYSQARDHIISAADIVNTQGSIYDTGSHGAMVLALIAGMVDDTIIGTATKAEYCLYRAEDDDSESMKEADNVVRALEMADSAGVDIATISLGYYEFDDTTSNYTYADMNGRIARCSRAATMAANKGMLVCVAAGNEGDKEWHYIDSPADAEDILTVGGVEGNREYSRFSSLGPTSDMRIKPDICAMATAVPIYYPTDFARHNGTSFASPAIAGAAACLWSALPQLTAQQLRETIIRHSDRYSNPDNQYGYGIPDMTAAYYEIAAEVESPKPTEDNNITAVYTINGIYCGNDLNRLGHGIYIVRLAGSVRKIMK